ncbi:MAG TPA: DUF3291 domain-containing protein [Terriglobales bacterium]|nr:DUF3291 domain-containing protein [Terriglobales bacterium]
MALPSLPPADPHHHVAQVNVARVLAPLDTPALKDFVDSLEPVNALADRSPGFVWRLQTESGDATAIRPYDDERIMVNLSVWRSPADLWNFVYLSRHLDFVRRRREWFERIEPYLALWWVPAGTVPSVEEAKQRLERLRRDGPGPEAFTFRAPWGAPAPRAGR